MPVLTRPTLAVHESWLEAASESGYRPWLPAGWSVDKLRDPERFAEFVANQLADAEDSTSRPNGFVPATHLWYIDGDAFLGRLSIRHRLTPWLRDYGGHIGYDVRPSERRRGHATAMLQDALPWCADIGIDPVLVTCDTTNIASRKVIAAAGGNFENELDGKYRYWVPAHSPTPE